MRVLLIDDGRKSRGENTEENDLESLRYTLVNSNVGAVIEDCFRNNALVKKADYLAGLVMERVKTEGFQGLVIDIMWPGQEFFGIEMYRCLTELGCRIAPEDVFFLTKSIKGGMRDDIHREFGIPKGNVLSKLESNSLKKIVEWFRGR
jgi:hypothetical protein